MAEVCGVLEAKQRKNFEEWEEINCVTIRNTDSSSTVKAED